MVRRLQTTVRILIYVPAAMRRTVCAGRVERRGVVCARQIDSLDYNEHTGVGKNLLDAGRNFKVEPIR